MIIPKVSICIPAYKQPEYLRRALESIQIQTFKDYEVIVTDDSPDSSVEEVVREFQPNNKLRYFKNKERKGTPGNWNEAVSLANGEYIKILHHDDWFYEKESLTTFVKMLDENPQADFAFASCLAYAPDQKFLFTHSPPKKNISELRFNPSRLFPKNFIGAPSVTIYRNKSKKNFDPKLKWLVDIDFYIRILKDNNFFIYWPEPLVCITTGGDSQVTSECSNSKSIEIFEWLYLYSKLDNHIMPNLKNVKFIWNLLRKYQVCSVNEILKTGVEPPIPLLVRMMVYLNKFLSV